MRKNQYGQWIFSPTDLVNFLGCQHSIYLDLNSTRQVDRSVQPDPSERLLKDLGNKHETDYLNQMKKKRLKIVEIPKPFTTDKATGNHDSEFKKLVILTIRAMKEGADIIYQAALQSGNWAGYADFLVKENGKSKFGSYQYEVIDTKLARQPEAKHIVQLIVYAKMLEQLQGVQPKKVHVVLGTNEKVEFVVGKYDSYIHHAQKRFELFLANPPEQSYPERCKHCAFCKWKDTCENQWEVDNALTLVANITNVQIRKLQQSGINAVDKLAQSGSPNFPEKLGIAKPVLQRLVTQAKLQEFKRKTKDNKYIILKQEMAKGFARLPKADPGDLFFDMEGNPLFPGGLEYLFGVSFQKKGKKRFLDFWAHDEKEEAETFGRLMEFFVDHLRNHPKAHIYHYNHYEVTALNRLANKHATSELELRELLRAGKFVDLYTVVRESIQISEPSYSLKNLEVFFYPEGRDGSVITAMDSIVVYNQWREHGDPELLDSLRAYNQKDCESTSSLRDWLLEIKPVEVEWFKEGAEEPGDYSEKDSAENQQHLLVRGRLEKCDPKSIPHAQAVADLLEFHRRESSCKWREIITRSAKSLPEILDDFECLAGLTKFGKRKEEDGKWIQDYSFPDQETKIVAGNLVADVNDINKSWEVEDLDHSFKRISLSLKQKKTPYFPETVSIGLKDVVRTASLRDSIYRYAEDCLQGGGNYPGLDDILTRRLPRLRRKGSSRDSNENQDPLEFVNALNNSYIIIQGPPGTGKTRTSAQIIVKLLAAGKKVGIAANSHKVINNLLDKIVEIACKDGVQFSGFKKSSGGNKEHEFNSSQAGGELVKNVNSLSKQQKNKGDLFAGTGWLFSSSDFDQSLDYLFIDEAGQVALANVVAMGTSAKNLVLVGDQMQLGQPIQAVHPGESGRSVLDYLLQGQETIHENQGIFLSETHRLHPSICNFVSEVFYDSKLRSHPKTKKFQLNYQPRFSNLDQNEIYFAPIHHEGNSQMCEAEGLAIQELYGQLLKMKFDDGFSGPRSITQNDILVVSPYNLQVDYLEDLLGPGARVGTVDKFQGQEAPIVLVSMASSDAETMPRGHDFLFSPNRLNVAISRAKCLSIVFANPKLLAAPCSTPGQMELVNYLCKYAEKARWVENWVDQLKTLRR